MFVSLSHTISEHACARALSTFLPTALDNSCCCWSSLTGWDLWQIAKLVKACKNWVHTNKQKHALSQQNSRIKAVWAKVTTWSSFMYKKNVAPGFVAYVCVCVSLCVYMTSNNKFAVNIKQICRKRDTDKKIKRVWATTTTKLIQFQVWRRRQRQRQRQPFVKNVA